MPRPLAFVLSLFLSAAVGAITDAEVSAQLGRDIIPAALPLQQLQDHLELSVADIPSIDNETDWRSYADSLRRQILDLVIFRGEAAAWRDAPTRVEWQDVIENPGPGYRLRKFILEVLPGMWVPGILYEPEPIHYNMALVLNFNGHHAEDLANADKQLRCINQAKRGMYALSVGFLGMGQTQTPGFSHYRINQLDLCGASGVAPFYLAMLRALELGLSLPYVDPERVAVTGLSGGGWQTILFSPLETRVSLADPVAGFSGFRTRVRHFQDLGDSEQAPVDLGWIADYTHLCALMAPRPLLLTYNQYDDCCFQAPYALPPLLSAARPAYDLLGAPGALRSYINYSPGTHNYGVDNRQAFYRMLGDFFYPGDINYSAIEIPSESEVKSSAELRVTLPSPNQDFHTLALALAQKLPRNPAIPEDPFAFIAWQAERRAVLSELVRLPRYDAVAELVASETGEELFSTAWRLGMGGRWTVPAVLLTPLAPQGAAILISDSGRTSLTSAAMVQLIVEKRAVLAMDPIFIGESRPASYPDLMAIMLSAVGDRPLGISAGQVLAAAHWLRDEQRLGPPALLAYGSRSSLVARVAAALEPELFSAVEVQSALPSLRQVITNNWIVANGPEYFCFGLLEEFDMPQLAALAEPPPPLPTPTPTSTPAGPGDVLVDGRIDGLDLFLFSFYWQQDETEFSRRADLLDDGRIDENDLLRLIEALQGP
ncbi:hypothetical protein HS125_19145 [bacterium]|nr:hypothetical protein [bacterium]